MVNSSVEGINADGLAPLGTMEDDEKEEMAVEDAVDNAGDM